MPSIIQVKQDKSNCKFPAEKLVWSLKSGAESNQAADWVVVSLEISEHNLLSMQWYAGYTLWLLESVKRSLFTNEQNTLE